jgi:transcriptional regulator with XRE-family HTH domain
MTEFPDPWHELGSFIREQRSGARLSLRRLSDLTGISNPYLSQIERGLRRPSAEILREIAKALTISAETLYVRAGILEARRVEGDLADAILAEGSLTVEQRQTLLRIFLSFRRENEGHGGPPTSVSPEGGAPLGDGTKVGNEPRTAGATS